MFEIKGLIKRMLFGYISVDKIWRYRNNALNCRLPKIVRKYNSFQLGGGHFGDGMLGLA